MNQQKFGLLPTFLFVHIPLIEYSEAWNEKNCFGMHDDGVSPVDNENDFFKAINDQGNIISVFVGHNHGNAWCCPYKGLHFCFGRHSGYGGYGTWDRGVRMIMLYEGKDFFETWVRMENGEMLDRRKIPFSTKKAALLNV